jgi:threonine synthase
MQLLAETEGIFTETAGGVVISALRSMVRAGVIGPDEETVALITGTGLKTLEAIADTVETKTIDPNVRSFDEIVTGAEVN